MRAEKRGRLRNHPTWAWQERRFSKHTKYGRGKKKPVCEATPNACEVRQGDLANTLNRDGIMEEAFAVRPHVGDARQGVSATTKCMNG